MYMMINFSIFHNFSLSQEKVWRRDCVVHGSECNLDVEEMLEKLKTTSFPCCSYILQENEYKR